MDSVTESWDNDLVWELFCEEDAKEILAIPVRSGMDDQVAWHFDAKGQFSVKSAYHLGVKLRDSKRHRDASSCVPAPAVSHKGISNSLLRRIPNSTRILHQSSVISTHILLTSVATSTISYLHADLTEVHQNVAPSPSPLPTGHVLPAVRRWDDAGGQGVRGVVAVGRGGGGGATEVGPAVHCEGFAEGRVAYRGGGPVAADAGRGDGPGSAS
ncbi:NAC domain-containing protein 78 [Hordeum vulgare]|nr:NAC domain-containing protein 78 [Hordeum vulgare]